MCWNAPVSYMSLAFGYTMMYLIWTRPASSVYKKSYDYWCVLFIASFVSMQLGEGLIHQGYNDIGRQIIFWCVVFQPIMQTIGGAYFGGIQWLYYLAALCFIMIPFVSIDKKIGCGPSGHLVWSVKSFNTDFITMVFSIIYMLGLFLPLLLMKPMSRFIILPIFMFITLAVSIYNWWGERAWSSMWCFMAAIYSVIVYYVNQV
jgi:hypothetical protein